MRRIPPKEYFNPLPPYGGRPTFAAAIAPICRNFNPLPPYGGRHPERRCKRPHRNFNPLPPYGGRLPAVPCCARSYTFQSTPSVWRETSCHRSIQLTGKNFNPLPPYGGRPVICGFHNNAVSISIHSLRMEGDTDNDDAGLRHYIISIHSLRMEGDAPESAGTALAVYFNPLPPYGGRQTIQGSWIMELAISIHSLRMEGDRRNRAMVSALADFNPLPPYGGRQQNCTGKRFSFRLSLYNPAKKDAKDYILHPKK